MSESLCDVCVGAGKNLFNGPCPYCNGTGEWNDAASAYVKNHICQCIVWDREFCPVCHKECHHDTTVSPKQVIDDGFGGLGAAKSMPKQEEEELIVA